MARVVLIVDDQAPVRGVCRAFLSREGYEILEAENGLQALSLCQSYKVDVLLTDVKMPGFSGIELARRVDALKLGIRVVYMSGWIPEDESVPIGARFLQKPFTPLALMNAIREAMSTFA